MFSNASAVPRPEISSEVVGQKPRIEWQADGLVAVFELPGGRVAWLKVAVEHGTVVVAAQFELEQKAIAYKQTLAVPPELCGAAFFPTFEDRKLRLAFMSHNLSLL